MLAAAIGLVLSIGCTQRPRLERFQWKGGTMGTFFSITVLHSGTPQERFDSLKMAIDAALDRVNRQMSTYIPDSEISRFNNFRDTTDFAVSPEFGLVVKTALQVAVETDGAFDITVGPLVDLWGFGPPGPPQHLPTEEEIVRELERVGYHCLQVTDVTHIRKLNPDVRIDLSAIAKGYAVDLVSELVESMGFKNYMIDIGGEIYARGLNANGEYWNVGIDTPAASSMPGESVQKVLALSDVAVATSGDYRNFTEIGGVVYSHEIDPRTGWPVSHKLASATVIASSCMIADAYATGVMVLGPVDGLELLSRLPDIQGLIIERTDDGEYIQSATDGFDDYVK